MLGVGITLCMVDSERDMTMSLIWFLMWIWVFLVWFGSYKNDCVYGLKWMRFWLLVQGGLWGYIIFGLRRMKMLMDMCGKRLAIPHLYFPVSLPLATPHLFAFFLFVLKFSFLREKTLYCYIGACKWTLPFVIVPKDKGEHHTVLLPTRTLMSYSCMVTDVLDHSMCWTNVNPLNYDH